MRNSPRARLGAVIALTATLLVAFPSSPAAHEIPANVLVRMFVRPEHDRLTIAVRVPLEAMRDVEFPLRGVGYLDLVRTRPLLGDAARLWIASHLTVSAAGTPLPPGEIAALALSLPSDRSFGAFDDARAHFDAPPLPDSTDIPWKQALLDVLLVFPLDSATAPLTIDPRFARLGVRTTTVLRYLPASGGERAYQYVGDPGLIRLDPRWYHAAGQFMALGIEHILGGVDHLLFVLCLVIPIRRWRPLLIVVTAFTVAHSITLLASAAGFAPTGLWFPPLVEALIALSIVYMALENIIGARIERRWAMAFAFGLVHGFGFSFALRESLQFAGGHLLSSLVSFNVGVELGQIAVLALAIPALSVLYTRVVAERMGVIILSAFIAHTAWHWLGDRTDALREFSFEGALGSVASPAGVVRVLLGATVLASVAWVGAAALRRRSSGTGQVEGARAGQGAVVEDVRAS